MTDSELNVDLRGLPIETLNDFWDAVSGPCGLPEWFGRNLDAWSDTIETRGISEVIDSHDAWSCTSIGGVFSTGTDRRPPFWPASSTGSGTGSSSTGRPDAPFVPHAGEPGGLNGEPSAAAGSSRPPPDRARPGARNRLP